MAGGPAPAPRERGWARLLLALAAFVLLPVIPIPLLHAVVPVEHTLVLVVPLVAVCFLLGWWAGGSFSTALVLIAFAAFVLWRPAPPGTAGYYELARAWGLLLAGTFGAVCVLGRQGPFLQRALAAVVLTTALAGAVVLSTEPSVKRVDRVLSEQFAIRNNRSAAGLRALVRGFGDRVPTMRGWATQATVDQATLDLHRLSAWAVKLYPALLALQSLAACALAWALFHRFSRTRVGPPLAPLRQFRFNDQIAWAMIAGLVMVLLPTMDPIARVGQSMIVFAASLYALRGLGVVDGRRSGAAMVAGALALLTLLIPRRPFGVALALSAGVAALALFGISDMFADWRRPRAAS